MGFTVCTAPPLTMPMGLPPPHTPLPLQMGGPHFQKVGSALRVHTSLLYLRLVKVSLDNRAAGVLADVLQVCVWGGGSVLIHVCVCGGGLLMLVLHHSLNMVHMTLYCQEFLT